MTLFLFDWADETPSVLVDHTDRAAATEIATEIGGYPPTAGRELPPGVFVVALIVDGALEDPDVDALSVEWPPHVEETILDLLEDAARCGAEADGDKGELLTCELDAGHSGAHGCGAGAFKWAAA